MDKRKDYGEEMPGSRKDQAGSTKKALSRLAALGDHNTDVNSEQLYAELLKIRRDDIWGTLEERLARLTEQGASPALALAWRTLYRSVAASAGSMDLKPTGGRYFRLLPKDAYVFGVLYETALNEIAANMESFPLDVAWPEINRTALRTRNQKYHLTGAGIVEEITMVETVEKLTAKEAVEKWIKGEVDTWLESVREDPGPKNLLDLTRKKSRSSKPLSIARREVFSEYAPSWQEELDTLASGIVARVPTDDAPRAYRALRDFLDSTLLGDYPLDNSHYPRSYLKLVEAHCTNLDSLADELYSRVSSAQGFDPWNTLKTKKASSPGDTTDAAPFVSVLRPKIMPATRFENLKRETSLGAPNPRVGNVTEDELFELVPFRGIQYGNWATQSERQEMLNMAYDALADLALALGVSPQYLALPVPGVSGTQNLGLALGARGRGGNASAHYEPQGHVINLTKTKGGGALAHEWMHAYDHKLATDLNVSVQLASETKGNQVSDYVNLLRNHQLGTGSSEAKRVSRQLRRDMMLEILLPLDLEQKLSELSGADSWKTFGGAFVETIAEWSDSSAPVKTYACQGIYLKTEEARDNMEAGLTRHGVPIPAATAIANLWSSEVAASDWVKLDRRLYRDLHAQKGRTAYLINAQVLNGHKSIGYWTAPTELFARAGSAVVFDRLREIHGIANGFLDASSDPANFNPKIHKANSNPAGAERERFNTAFSERLLVAMQQEDANATYRVKVGSQMRMHF